MEQALRGLVRHGRIELLAPSTLAEGEEVLVTPVQDRDNAFWTAVSNHTFESIWGGDADDVYAQLLQE